jgi:hypothetical protein
MSTMSRRQPTDNCSSNILFVLLGGPEHERAKFCRRRAEGFDAQRRVCLCSVLSRTVEERVTRFLSCVSRPGWMLNCMIIRVCFGRTACHHAHNATGQQLDRNFPAGHA